MGGSETLFGPCKKKEDYMYICTNTWCLEMLSQAFGEEWGRQPALPIMVVIKCTLDNNWTIAETPDRPGVWSSVGGGCWREISWCEAGGWRGQWGWHGDPGGGTWAQGPVDVLPAHPEQFQSTSASLLKAEEGRQTWCSPLLHVKTFLGLSFHFHVVWWSGDVSISNIWSVI